MNVVCIGILVTVCSFPDPPKPTSVICPPVVAWSGADQKAAAVSLGGLPAKHPLRTMAIVAVKQRDLARRCAAATK